MPTIDMKEVNAAADAEYEPCIIRGVPGGDVTLLPVTRLSTEKREALFALDDAPKPAKKAAASKSGSPTKRAAAKKAADSAGRAAEAASTIGSLEKLLQIVAATDDEGKRLLDHLNGDVARLSFIVKEWQKATQPGEAEPSPS